MPMPAVAEVAAIGAVADFTEVATAAALSQFEVLGAALSPFGAAATVMPATGIGVVSVRRRLVPQQSVPQRWVPTTTAAAAATTPTATGFARATNPMRGHLVRLRRSPVTTKTTASRGILVISVIATDAWERPAQPRRLGAASCHFPRNSATNC